ncbi:hypothetical protein LQF67_01625 [Tetragenococcus halophilus]|uniref:hypothetical protein n=1 Tax=Tetragenococcus halophilus TaxID=51669 RepID=UPI001F35E142|nr:hypothetical protein [Tetragenococcus halophilus]MCF1684277.1 hypothetical protein [Tetragenococcus halophilus]
MVEYVSFHGTESSVAEKKIRYDAENLEFTSLTRERQKRYSNRGGSFQGSRKSKPKSPGSLGYGFYTFIRPENMAEQFISRICESYKIIEVKTVIKENEVLDFEDEDTRFKFHEFRQSFKKHIDAIYRDLDRPRNTAKQHSVDGIIIESFINSLFKNENKLVNAVLMWTYTPLDGDESLHSYVPNSLELCIRNKRNICSLKERKE